MFRVNLWLNVYLNCIGRSFVKTKLLIYVICVICYFKIVHHNITKVKAKCSVWKMVTSSWIVLWVESWVLTLVASECIDFVFHSVYYINFSYWQDENRSINREIWAHQVHTYIRAAISLYHTIRSTSLSASWFFRLVCC